MRCQPDNPLDSNAMPFPLRSPLRFLHPPSPLARFARDAMSCQSSCPASHISARRPPSILHKCPPLSLWQHELYKPIDREGLTRPSTSQFASFYALAYNPPPPFELKLGDIHRSVRDLDDPDLISFDVIDKMEIDSIPSFDLILLLPSRPVLQRRRVDPCTAHKLSAIRMRFISKHIPRLAEALHTMFAGRTEGDDRFCTWFHSLPVDQRAELHPTLQLERHLATCGPVSADDFEVEEVENNSVQLDFNVLSDISNRAKRTREQDAQPPEERPVKRPRHASLQPLSHHESRPGTFFDADDDLDLVRRWFQVMALRQPKVDFRKHAMIAHWKKQRKIAHLNSSLYDHIIKRNARVRLTSPLWKPYFTEYQGVRFDAVNFVTSWRTYLGSLPSESKSPKRLR